MYNSMTAKIKPGDTGEGRQTTEVDEVREQATRQNRELKYEVQKNKLRGPGKGTWGYSGKQRKEEA